MEGWGINNWIQTIVYIASVSIAFSSMRTKLDFLAAQINKLEHRLESMENESRNFMGRFAAIERQVDSNSSLCSRLQDRVSNLELQMASCRSHILE